MKLGCNQEKLINIEINEKLDNECDVKLHSKTSYCWNLWHLVSDVLAFKN
jgi:hypothetical protein